MINGVFSADIILLDDPLSSVDMEVAKKIMTDCICGELKNKTRVIVTNAINHLKHADLILVLDQGRIVFEGGFAEVEKNEIYQQLKSNKSKVSYLKNRKEFCIIKLKHYFNFFIESAKNSTSRSKEQTSGPSVRKHQLS